MDEPTPATPYCPLCDCIKLTKGKFAIVGPEDRKRIGLKGWKAKKSRGGWYAYKTVKTKNKVRYIYMHRLITSCPPGMVVHHINGNGLDNRKCNLQILAPAEHEQLSRHLRIAKTRTVDKTLQNSEQS